jgi:LuxR family maltose regulon positive regulatory protein
METRQPNLGETLTNREYEIYEILISTDFNNQEIADKLFISLHTVKFHAGRIYIKQGVTGRLQLIFKEWAGLAKGGAE